MGVVLPPMVTCSKRLTNRQRELLHLGINPFLPEDYLELLEKYQKKDILGDRTARDKAKYGVQSRRVDGKQIREEKRCISTYSTGAK